MQVWDRNHPFSFYQYTYFRWGYQYLHLYFEQLQHSYWKLQDISLFKPDGIHFEWIYFQISNKPIFPICSEFISFLSDLSNAGKLALKENNTCAEFTHHWIRIPNYSKFPFRSEFTSHQSIYTAWSYTPQQWAKVYFSTKFFSAPMLNF